METVPTKEEWDDLQQHTSFLAFKELLRQRREEFKEQWANGNFTVTDNFTTVISNTRAQAQAEVLAAILELDYATFLGEVDNGKHAPEPLGPSA